MTNATFLSRFTPSTMTAEALEAIFVQHEELASYVVGLVRDSALTPTKHHTLLIGPRGIGKTHFISLVYYRLRAMADLQDRLLIAWLREEEWSIASFLDLLIAVLQALLMEQPNQALGERIEALFSLPADDAERQARAMLKECVGQHTLLLLMENLDEVFAGLGDEGQKRWRACLQENPVSTILATSQSLFNGVSLQTSPFYGFFRIRHLPGLSFDDAVQLLSKIAHVRGDSTLATFMQSPTGRDRIRAVAHLAGDNPRVYVILAQFLNYESLDELVEPLMQMLDDLTPYYQSRMLLLSPQQRKIIDLLCDCHHAVSVGEIAQRCFISPQTASSQLGKLREYQYVHTIAIGRESYYEIHEPLMRLCMEFKKQRGTPIRLFVEFLRLWYSRTELQQRLETLRSGATIERTYLLKALEIGEGAEARPWPGYQAKTTPSVTDAQSAEEALASFDRALELAPDDAGMWYNRGIALTDLGRHEEALAADDRALELSPDDADLWYARGIDLGNLGRHEEALASFDRALALAPEDAQVWQVRGIDLASLGRHEEALASFDYALELAPEDARVRCGRGIALGILGRYEEALASFDRALELAPDDANVWHGRGLALRGLRRYEEALSASDMAIAAGIQTPEAFFDRVLYLVALGRWDDGVAALDDTLNRFAEARESASDAAESILRRLLEHVGDAARWPLRIATLLDTFGKHDALSALGQGLVRSITTLVSPLIADAAAREWLHLWRELASNHVEMELPLRLLEAAVSYHTSGDRRALLELSIEERAIIQSMVGAEDLSGSNAGT